MRILVVDDSKAVHAFITSLFAETKHELKHVFNGREAVTTAREQPAGFDLILMDWEMPKLCGVDALQEIRLLGVTTPVLMVTTKNEPESIGLALERGATDFVMKPFTKDILFGKIAEVCGREVS